MTSFNTDFSSPGQSTAGPARPQPGRPAPSHALDSASLLGGQKAVEIIHNGASYRLQATRLGKLILTK